MVIQKNIENGRSEDIVMKRATENTLILIIRKSQMKFLGDIMWKVDLKNTSYPGYFEGKK